MDIVTNFKQYLEASKNPPSSITIKNYLSDVRKFLTWYNLQFRNPFVPTEFTSTVISQYQAAIQSRGQSTFAAVRSAKRYISSLRKFTDYLIASGQSTNNPFYEIVSIHTITDPFFLKEFNGFLFTEHAKPLTIKNYIADLKQFINWLSRVSDIDISTYSELNTSSLLSSIDNFSLEQYKIRLLNEAKLSPISINRKLSAIRRYIQWLVDKGIINQSITPSEVQYSSEIKDIDTKTVNTALVIPEMPLIALHGLADQEKEDKQHYSGFPPIRLAQKISRLISLGSDLLLFNTLAHVAETIYFSFWKNSGKSVFAPISAILESSSFVPNAVSVKTIIPKASSILPPRTANLSSVLEQINNLRISSKPETVHNFTKALYAPLKISKKHLPWRQKLIHTIRYTRPKWYSKYHSYVFVHYLHIGILVLATVIAGEALYQTWIGQPTKNNQAVLSAMDTAPPRTLSFQGRLLDNNNSPITAETPLRFGLYNSQTASGAALVWQEVQSIKPDQNGYFTATLGNNVRMSQNLFTENPSLYIGVTVGDNQELSPRQQIPTTQYSSDTQSIQGLKPITDSPTIAQNVLLALDSLGNLTIGGNSNHTFQATGGNFTLSGQTLLLTTNASSSGNIKIAPDGSGIVDIEKPIRNMSNYTGPSGIPGAIEIDDILSVFATASSQSALVINQNSTGDIISGRSNGIDKFRIDNTGNEYLGGDLILNGDTIDTNATSFDIAGPTVKNLTIGDEATSVTLGGTSGITSINNNLSINGSSSFTGPITANGLLTTNAGLTIPDGQKLTLDSFTQNAIPFVNGNSQIVQDANNFSWNDSNDSLNVNGTICVYNANNACGTVASGTIYAASYQTDQTADLAEEYVSSQTLQPGDVVVLEGQNNSMAILKSTSPYQTGLIGIISTNPGITLDSSAKTDADHPYRYPLALQGRVPVNVSTNNGPIQAGDNITSSSIPGVAMKASSSGQIIGKALESYTNNNPNDVGKIMVFVNLTYQSNPTNITDTGNLASASALENIQTQTQLQSNLLSAIANISDTISVGAIQAKSITTQSLQVTTDTIMIGGQTLEEYITALVEKLVNQAIDKRLSQVQPIIQIVSPVASNSGVTLPSISPTPLETPKPTVTSSNSASASPVIQIIQQISSPSAYTIYNNTATVSAISSPSASQNQTDETQNVTPTTTITPNSSSLPIDQSSPVNTQPNTLGNIDTESIDNQFEPVSSISAQLPSTSNLQTEFATVTQGFTALGPTSLTDVGISGILSINNNLKITADSINTIGSNLNIQPLRQGNILFMGGLVTIDTQGNIQISGDASFAHNVSVNGELAAGIIAPIPQQDLIINLNNKTQGNGSSLIVNNAKGTNVLTINQSGDVISSGEAEFKSVASNNFTIIRGAQADTSMTETVANGSAGSGVITAYETQRTIITPYVTSHSLIYITPTSETDGVTPYLARQTIEDSTTGTKGSFTVSIESPITKDIGFNWWIVN